QARRLYESDRRRPEHRRKYPVPPPPAHSKRMPQLPGRAPTPGPGQIAAEPSHASLLSPNESDDLLTPTLAQQLGRLKARSGLPDGLRRDSGGASWGVPIS